MQQRLIRLGEVLFIVLISLTIGACKEQIVHDLSETEANKLVAKLALASVTAEKVAQPDSRYAIAVDDSQALQALSYLSENRILRDARPSPPENASLTSGRDEQRFVFERKLSGEIEATLTTVGGILEARVHLNLPVVDPLFGRALQDQRGTASVLLIIEPDSTVEKLAIAALVSGAAGVPKENVTVLVSRGEGRSPRSETRPVVPSVTNPGTAVIPEPMLTPSWRVAALSVLRTLTTSHVVAGVGAGLLIFFGGTLISRRRLRKMVAFHEPK